MIAENEARLLLFSDDVMRGQLLSELTLLISQIVNNTEPAKEELFKLRLMMHFMEVSSKYPAVGTILIKNPRILDTIITKIVMDWMYEEVERILSLSSNIHSNAALQNHCHHFTKETSSIYQFQNNNNNCSICAWIIQWPLNFLEMIKNGIVKINVYCALNYLPSCFTNFTEQMPFQRPSDTSIGIEQWIHVIGHITEVFFRNRESINPEPIVQIQPFLSNYNGIVGQTPIWLDLSILPHNEFKLIAIVGERIHIFGLLESFSKGFGTKLYSKRNDFSSSIQLIIEARAVYTNKFISQWSHDPNMIINSSTMSSSLYIKNKIPDLNLSYDVNETDALLEAKCSWEIVAGAAAFLSAKATGGFYMKENNNFRAEAIFAASKAFILPASIWALIGIIHTSATILDGTISSSFIGSTDYLNIVQTFLLELSSETNIIIPIIHGLENSLLPIYTRINASQINIPISNTLNSQVESVRSGLLNISYQRIIFLPSLQAISTSALHAIQGVGEGHENVVVRDSGQRVMCKAVGAFIIITQETMLIKHRHLFHFIERGDVVLSVSSSSISLQDQADLLLQLIPINHSSENDVTMPFINRCQNQWNLWSKVIYNSYIDEMLIPQLSNACASLLQTYFFVAKSICGEAVDASMMNTLVKLTCAHALFRYKVHKKYKDENNNLINSTICFCNIKNNRNNEFTNLIDAIIAIALCDGSLKFINGISLIGDLSIFEIITGNEEFNIIQFVKQLHHHLISSIPKV